MCDTDAGRMTEVILVHSLKASCPTSVTAAGRVIGVSCEHL